MTISFPAGTIVDNRYALLRELGSGGMGTVYQARELELDRIVAIKILHSTLQTEEQNRLRFEREGKVLACVSHAHLLRFYRFGLWKHRWLYIAMEYVEGRSLRQLLLEQPELSIERCINITVQACEAMESAHRSGIVHRDLSSNNIMLLDRQDDFIKVIDFGLSLLAGSDAEKDQRLTGTGVLIGSLYYMSPEQCSGKKADQRSDIYALGCILYQLLAGIPPFDAPNPIALIYQHTSGVPLPLSNFRKDLPAGLENLTLRAMAKEPENRYQSMSEMCMDLKLVASGCGAEISPTSGSKKFSISHRVVLATIVVAVFLLLIPATRKAAVPTQTPAPPTRNGDALKGMRRLRMEESMMNWTPTEKQEYYVRWLSMYASDTDFTADTINAYTRLSNLIDATAPVEARTYRRKALQLTESNFTDRVKHGANGMDAGIALIKVLESYHDDDFLIKVLRKYTREIETGGQRQQLFRTWCLLKNALADSLCRAKRYEDSLECYEKLLESKCEEIPLNAMVGRYSTLWHLGRKSEAREALTATSNIAFEQHSSAHLIDQVVEGNSSTALDPVRTGLIEQSLAQDQDNLCLQLCNTFLTTSSSATGRIYICRVLQTKMSVLQKMHRLREAFEAGKQLLSYDPSPSVWFEQWAQLNLINASIKLNSTPYLAEIFNAEIARVYPKNNKADIYQMHFILNQTVHTYLEFKDRNSAMQLLEQLEARWRPNDVSTIGPPALGIASEFQLVGAPGRALEFLQALRNREAPGELGSRLDLNICQFIAAMMMVNNKKAESVQFMDEFLAKTAPRRNDGWVTGSMLLTKADLTRRELRQPDKAREILDEVLRLTESTNKDKIKLTEHERAHLRAECSVVRGLIAHGAKDYPTAIRLFNDAYHGTVNLGTRMRAISWLARTYATDAQYTNARDAYERFLALVDPKANPREYRNTLQEFKNFAQYAKDPALQKSLDIRLQASLAEDSSNSTSPRK